MGRGTFTESEKLAAAWSKQKKEQERADKERSECRSKFPSYHGRFDNYELRRGRSRSRSPDRRARSRSPELRRCRSRSPDRRVRSRSPELRRGRSRSPELRRGRLEQTSRPHPVKEAHVGRDPVIRGRTHSRSRSRSRNGSRSPRHKRRYDYCSDRSSSRSRSRSLPRRNRSRSRSRSRGKMIKMKQSWSHDRFQQHDSLITDDVRPRDATYRPPSPTWVSRAGGVAIMKKTTSVNDAHNG